MTAWIYPNRTKTSIHANEWDPVHNEDWLEDICGRPWLLNSTDMNLPDQHLMSTWWSSWLYGCFPTGCAIVSMSPETSAIHNDINYTNTSQVDTKHHVTLPQWDCILSLKGSNSVSFNTRPRSENLVQTAHRRYLDHATYGSDFLLWGESGMHNPNPNWPTTVTSAASVDPRPEQGELLTIRQ